MIVATGASTVRPFFERSSTKIILLAIAIILTGTSIYGLNLKWGSWSNGIFIASAIVTTYFAMATCAAICELIKRGCTSPVAPPAAPDPLPGPPPTSSTSALPTPTFLPPITVTTTVGQGTVSTSTPPIPTFLPPTTASSSISTVVSAPVPETLYTRMQRIRADRLEDVEAEVARLKRSGVLDTDVIRFTTRVMGNRGGQQDPTPLEIAHFQVLWGRALEIKRLYQKTHYVFIHGQAAQFLVWPYFYKEMHRSSDRPFHSFKPLREESCCVPARSCTEAPQAKSAVFKRLQKGEHDHFQRNVLLSVDAYFSNQQIGESCAIFTVNNRSIIMKDEAGTNALHDSRKRYLRRYVSDEQVADGYCTRLAVQEALAQRESSCGNIVVIAVKKALLQNDNTNFAYLSHPFGQPCHCDSRKLRTSDRLDELQNGTLRRCDRSWVGDNIIPQVRLHTDFLTPENCDIFLLTSVPKAVKKAIKVELRTIAAELHKHAGESRASGAQVERKTSDR